MYSYSGHFRPVWGRRGLYGADFNPSDEPVIWCIDENGARDDIRFSFEGAHHITILGAAEAPTGGIALVGGAYSDDGRGATFLSIIQANRSAKIVVRIWPFVPRMLTITPDGVVWVLGFDRTPDDRVQQYNVLRRFDSSGNLLSTTALKVRGPSWDLDGDATSWSVMRASTDRVGWLTTGNEYLEFDMDGHEISRLNGPPGRFDHDEIWTSFVLSETNEAIIAVLPSISGDAEMTFWNLNRSNRTWTLVIGNGILGRVDLFGFDGDTIVASGKIVSPNGGPRQTIDWYTLSIAGK
jgi:hypothetical protein